MAAGQVAIHILDGETVEQDVRPYELLSLLPNSFTEDEVPGVITKIQELIKAHGGEISKEINYGKRRLAYPVKHNHYGYYILHHFTMLPQEQRDMDKKLRVMDEVLRYLITKPIDEKAIPHEVTLTQEQAPAPKKVEEEKEQPAAKKPSITDAKATKEEKAKMAKGSSFDLEKELGVTEEEAKAELAKAKETATDSKDSVDLEGLDKKLDEIMGDLEGAEKDEKASK